MQEAYDKMNALSGEVYEFSTQSNELRNIEQVYRRKQEIKPKRKPTDSHELVALIRYQRENTNLLRSVEILDQSYYGFIATDAQLKDIVPINFRK